MKTWKECLPKQHSCLLETALTLPPYHFPADGNPALVSLSTVSRSDALLSLLGVRCPNNHRSTPKSSYSFLSLLQYHTHFSPLTSHPALYYKQALCQCGYYRPVSSARLPLAPRFCCCCHWKAMERRRLLAGSIVRETLSTPISSAFRTLATSICLQRKGSRWSFCTSSTERLINFAGDKTAAGFISNDGRVEMEQLEGMCVGNSPSLNVAGTKKMIVDFRSNADNSPRCILEDKISWRPNPGGSHLEYKHDTLPRMRLRRP